jgi:transcriptional regulator with XRE-family HTH domain
MCNSAIVPPDDQREADQGGPRIPWLSQNVLADKAELSCSAMARLELEETEPHADTIEAIYRALTAHGITFADDPSNGIESVQLRLRHGRRVRSA